MNEPLESKDIFCLHSKHIPLCGGVDIVAFDKVSPTFLTDIKIDLPNDNNINM